MESTMTDIELKDRWERLHQKFCVDYIKVFSNKDVDGWLAHMVPNKGIDVYQFGKDVAGKNGKGKTIKVYNGNVFSSLLKGRIPAKLMAKTVFKRLAKQDYSHSEMELLGIEKSPKKENQTSVLFRFKRFDRTGNMYQSAIGHYSLAEIENEWLISEMSVYDDTDQLSSIVDLSKMWHPDN